MNKETFEEVQLAILFHNTYENLAPNFGYETRADTKSFETTTPNGMLMIAVCKEIIKWMQERLYSEEDMFEFSQWISHEDWVYLPSKGYWVNEEQEELEQKFTTKQLIEQFKKK
jgi:hypothetical protein